MSAPSRCHDCKHRRGFRVVVKSKKPCGCACHQGAMDRALAYALEGLESLGK